jgi:hypothetical protein
MAYRRYYDKLMSSKEWRELRKRRLQEFPYCELHEERGMKVRATCVHHKKEVESAQTYEEMMRLCYDYDGNLQSLCNECHHRLHQAKGYNTRRAQKERKEAELARWINRFIPGET